jgi:hypothetical protein
MYRHKVHYRHRTPEGNLSAVKDLEFDLDKEMYYDGPGAWRDICRNMIANKTGLNKSDVMNDDNLRFTCKGKINSNSSPSTSNNSNNSNNDSWNSNNSRVTNDDSSDSDSHQPRVSYSKCSYCGEKYVIGDGYYSYLRPHNNENRHSSKKFNFCSLDCINNKVENGWVRVDEFGYTEEEGKQPASSEELELLDQTFNRRLIKQGRKEAEKELEETRKHAASLAACGPNHIDNSFTRKANHLESLLNETYPDRLKELEASEKDAQRKKRANELRSQGKNIQAFLLEFQNVMIAMCVLLALGIFFIYSNNDMTKQKNEAVRINLELEQIEDSVRLCINNKNYDRALILANKLVHPLNELYEGKGGVWEGEYYNLYWDKKREEYKNRIIMLGALETNTEAKSNSSKKKSSIDKAKSKKNKSKAKKDIEIIEDEVPVYDEELDAEYR